MWERLYRRTFGGDNDAYVGVITGNMRRGWRLQCSSRCAVRTRKVVRSKAHHCVEWLNGTRCVNMDHRHHAAGAPDVLIGRQVSARSQGTQGRGCDPWGENLHVNHAWTEGRKEGWKRGAVAQVEGIFPARTPQRLCALSKCLLPLPAFRTHCWIRHN